MTVVDRILDLCAVRGVSVARCERECGFSNGYLRKMQGKDVPSVKLQAAADFFGVSLEYLATGKGPAENDAGRLTEAHQAGFNVQVLELLTEAQKANTDDLNAVLAYLKRLNGYAEKIEKLERRKDAES